MGPRRSAANQADTGRSVKNALPQRQNGDALEPSQGKQRTTPNRTGRRRARAQPTPAQFEREGQGLPSGPACRPAHVRGPGTDRLRATGSAGTATSRIRSFGCEISDPHLMSAGEIARFLVVYLSLRLPVALLAVVMYPHVLKTIPADTRNLQLNRGELITVAVCVALFIVLACIVRIPRRRPRSGQPHDRT